MIEGSPFPFHNERVGRLQKGFYRPQKFSERHKKNLRFHCIDKLKSRYGIESGYTEIIRKTVEAILDGERAELLWEHWGNEIWSVTVLHIRSVYNFVCVFCPSNQVVVTYLPIEELRPKKIIRCR